MTEMYERLGIVAVALTMVSLGTSPHPFILILCYVIHEAGHITVARLVGAPMKRMRAGPFSLCLSYDNSGVTYKREIIIQLGGILFNFISAILVYALPFFKSDGATFFTVCSFSLALMNLYPVSVLDGGGALKNVFLLILPGDVAEKASKTVSFVCAILMWLVAVYLQLIFSSNMSLFVVSVVLLIELCFSLSS